MMLELPESAADMATDPTRVYYLTSSGQHLRIFLSEISSREEMNEMLHGCIGLMIRLLDLRWLRGSILGSVLKERVR